ncbi:MAG: phosphonate C-P lyase system protein PhnG [Deltaproteobacteria bacterium]|nr:phosphonate C-P lyase system protein PhnG [Deltaproteobacteria bacterium]
MSEIIFKKRQSLWIEASLKAVEEWADHLLQALGEVKVLVQPRPVLVMMHARDSVEQEVFCVGEILVTECQIACRGQRFWGRVVGDQPLRALCLV